MDVLTIDVEPWYSDLPGHERVGRPEWVREGTRDILALLEATGNTATFFVLTDVADRYPELVGEILAAGHEVGSHGTTHTPLHRLTPAAFDDEITRSLAALEDAGADRVVGFRAPQFSLDDRSTWALSVLADHGFEYDSSVFPVKTPLYGVPQAPRVPYRIDERTLMPGEGRLWELPPATASLPVVGTLPVAGGFYLRALPYPVLRAGLRAAPGPRVCYIHPWDLNPALPRIPEFGFTHYLGTGTARAKFARLLIDFQFTSAADYVAGQLASTPTDAVGLEVAG